MFRHNHRPGPSKRSHSQQHSESFPAISLHSVRAGKAGSCNNISRSQGREKQISGLGWWQSPQFTAVNSPGRLASPEYKYPEMPKSRPDNTHRLSERSRNNNSAFTQNNAPSSHSIAQGFGNRPDSHQPSPRYYKSRSSSSSSDFPTVSFQPTTFQTNLPLIRPHDHNRHQHISGDNSLSSLVHRLQTSTIGMARHELPHLQSISKHIHPLYDRYDLRYSASFVKIRTNIHLTRS